MVSPGAPRSESLASTSATIDPMTPIQLAHGELSSPSIGPISSPSNDSLSSSPKSPPLARPRSRKRSVSKKRSQPKTRKGSVRRARASSIDGRSASSLGIRQGRSKGVDVGTTISPKSQQDFHKSLSNEPGRPMELPLPFDVFWMAFSSKLAFLYALTALHPDMVVEKFPYGSMIKAIIPVGANWQIFARCSVLFALGSIPLRRWATNHLTDTNISSDQIAFWVFGIIKLALIQMFMFKSNETVYQAAMLHASLGFAVQELIVNIVSSPFTSSLQRMIEIVGNSIILFVAEDDLSVKAMAYTLTTLTLVKVLRALILIASSRESYRTFRKAVTIVHTMLLSFGIPFIGNFLMKSAKEMNADDTAPTYAHILGPFICASVLISSMIISHVDYLFN